MPVLLSVMESSSSDRVNQPAVKREGQASARQVVIPASSFTSGWVFQHPQDNQDTSLGEAPYQVILVCGQLILKSTTKSPLSSSFPFYSDPFLVFWFLWLFQVNDSSLKIPSHSVRKNMWCLSFWVWDTPIIVFTRSDRIQK